MSTHESVVGSGINGCADQATLVKSVEAARVVSIALQARDIPHAVIGGIACILHGSDRSTEDVDIVVDLPGSQVIELMNVLASSAGVLSKGNGRTRLYYLDTTPIEFLSTDHFAWPSPFATHVVLVASDKEGICVLRPTAIMINKIGRVGGFLGLGPLSDRPPRSQMKAKTDLYDIRYLLDVESLEEMLACARAYKTASVTRLVNWLDLLVSRRDEWEDINPGSTPFHLAKLESFRSSLASSLDSPSLTPAPHQAPSSSNTSILPLPLVEK